MAIIGGAGSMGKLFLHYFKSKGYSITISDTNQGEAEKTAEKEGVRLVGDNREAVEEADTVLISVPIEETPRVIEEVVPYMEGDALLVEISSVKGDIVKALKGIDRPDIKPLSIHPLFGPGARSLKGKRIAVVSVKDIGREADMTREIFGEAKVIPVDVEEHDRIVALTISLIYFINASLASILRGVDTSRLRDLGGPNFELQLLLCQGLLNQSPDSYERIRRANPYTDRWLSLYREGVEDLLEKIADGKATPHLRSLQKSFKKDPSFSKAYDDLYSLLEALEKREKTPDNP